MANTLTGLIPTIYAAKDIVLRELTGFIPAVTLDAGPQQVAVGQSVAWPVVPVETAAAITPAATGPDPADTTVAPDTMTISKSQSATFQWTGEEQVSLGRSFDVILRNQFEQCMRVLLAAVDTDLAALYVHASRAYGTAGTTPFASTLADAAEMYKVLVDNGAPNYDLQLVIDTAAGAKLRALAQLTKANEAGTDATLRRGLLMELLGFQIRESTQVKIHTAGTAASYLVDLSGGYAVGSTTVHLDTGTGTHLAGDILVNSASGIDANKYVIKTGAAGDADKDLVLAAPGLRKAWSNDQTTAIGAAYTANMAFSRGAIALMMRAPAMPAGGDAADDVTTVTDEATGISFQVAMYRQYRRVAYEVGLSWGVKAVRPEAIAILLG